MRETLRVYYIGRSKRPPLVFIQTDNALQFIEDLEQGDGKGFCGKTPESSGFRYLKESLDHYSEAAVRKWGEDRQFLLRFLLSALVFLFCFFVLSYVVKDPIPVIDEAVISLAAAALFFFVFRRRSWSSEKVINKQLSIKQTLERFPFEETPVLLEYEMLLDKLDHLDADHLRETLKHNDNDPIPGKDQDFRYDIVKGIRGQLGPKKIKKMEKYIQRENPNFPDGTGFEENIDFSLYVFYRLLNAN